MSFADDLWLGAMATRHNFVHIMSYNSAFCAHATLQALQLGVSAPRAMMAGVMRSVVAPRYIGLDRTPPHALPDAAKVLLPAAAEATDATADQAPSPLLLDEPRGGTADDLTLLNGVGAKLAATLNEFGIYHYDQIAELDAAGLDWLNDQQPGFKALQARFDLIGQARARG